MAKHNKWSKVKHRKAVVDKRRGKVWTKCSKAIIVAVRNSGADPATNIALRYAIDEARYANMPRDTIERAIKKGLGASADDNYEPVRYEGYGPGGVALIIDTLTNNRTRTVGDLRLALGKYGGNLGTSGSVAFLFEAKGEIIVDAAPPIDENDRKAKPIDPAAYASTIMETAIASGADDIEEPASGEAEGQWTILTSVPAFLGVKDALEAAKVRIAEASLAMVPSTRNEVRGEHAKNLLDLLESIEDLDDVQRVYSNADIPDDVLASIAE
jgi:YebC/PmpR family DNA-binding regulatory protein